MKLAVHFANNHIIISGPASSMYQIQIDQFSGPLDLLVQMIENEKLDISRVSLSKIADQFVDYIAKAEEIKLSELVDFLYLATRLLYLKSIILLPFPRPADEEEILKLEEQIKIYKEFREATYLIKNLLAQERFSFSRDKFYLSERYFVPPTNLNLKTIFITFQGIIKNLEKEFLIVRKIKKKIISLTDKIKEISALLARKKIINFTEITKKAKSRLELIIHFLALLELVKKRMIELKQEKIFGEIKITKT